MKTTLLVVGYRCEANEAGIQLANPPDFEAVCPKSFTGQKRQDRIAADREAWEQGLKDQPYTAELSDVYLVDMQGHRYVEFLPKADMSVTFQVAEWLVTEFPGAWPPLGGRPAVPSVMFLGFRPRHFLKMLGLNACLPSTSCPWVPPTLWFGNSDHRDMAEAVMPRDYGAGLDWSLVLASHRRGLDKRQAKVHDEVVKGWTGPGSTTARQDAEVAAMLALRLGFARDE